MPSGQANDRLADRGSSRTPKGQAERVLERRCLTGQAPQQLSAGEAEQPEWPSPQRESILAKARSRALERRIVLGQLECRSTRAAERRVPGMTERRVPDIWVPERRSGRRPERLRTGAAEGRSGREPERSRSEAPKAAEPSTSHVSGLAGQRRGWLSRVGRAGGPSRWGPKLEGPRRGVPIQGNRSKGGRAEGVRAEMADREGAEPRMSIQGCRPTG
jgi:hypothetical protein